MGISYETFIHLNPKKMKPFYDAHNIKIQQKDEEIWHACGTYFLSAVMTAVDRCLNGRKSSVKYIEHPLLRKDMEKEESLSEDEIKKQRELFVAKLMVMKTNFDMKNRK
jgi:hypothetical protein